MRQTDFKYNIGDNLIDEKRKLKIISRKRDRNAKGNARKYYKYRCMKCGWECGKYYNPKTNCYNEEYWITQDGLSDKQSGCICCCGDIVVKDKNDLLHTHPHLKKYLLNVEDGYTHTFQSNKRILCKCDICGNIKSYKVNNLVNKGFSCEKCSDGISYSEKIMMSVLQQLNVDYEYQFVKRNSNRRLIYDFYFTLGDEKYIIETNGIQHYINTKFSYSNDRTLKDEIDNDYIKMNFAINNGIKPENYIIIDAQKSDLSYIKSNILNSKLSNVFDLTNIDWSICELFAATSILIEICKDWKENSDNKTTAYLSEKYKLCRSTIIKYLKRGQNIGICIYDPNIEKEKQYEKMRRINTHGKRIEVLKNDKTVGVFINTRDLIRQSEQLFNIKMDRTSVWRVCNNQQKEYKGLRFRYI